MGSSLSTDSSATYTKEMFMDLEKHKEIAKQLQEIKPEELKFQKEIFF